MARQNRVTPEGTIIADPARGLFMGNRGILHDEAGRIVAPFRHRAWICCVTEFKGRNRKVMTPGNYTELFFLDEATALAAGHRPCAECRRSDYSLFRAAWSVSGLGAQPSAAEMDNALHVARTRPRLRDKVTFQAPLSDLPDGTFVRLPDGPALVFGQALLPWTPAGYGKPLPRPSGSESTVLTPAPIVAVLAAGYAPHLHPTATVVSHSR